MALRSRSRAAMTSASVMAGVLLAVSDGVELKSLPLLAEALVVSTYSNFSVLAGMLVKRCAAARAPCAGCGHFVTCIPPSAWASRWSA